MKLTTVTITGAADDTDIGALVALSAEFPFVEWGILLSKSQEGSPRFPSRKWMGEFASDVYGRNLRVSTHLCGQWVRQLLLGELDWAELPEFWRICGRMQINTHGRVHNWSTRMHNSLMRLSGKQVIFQWDGANDAVPYAADALGTDAAVLFDKSGGAGVVPGHWPPAVLTLPCGYAGGLGPDNVAEQLAAIGTVCDRPFWIDMERRVRSDDDRVLDLAKVRRVLETCAPHLDERSAP